MDLKLHRRGMRTLILACSLLLSACGGGGGGGSAGGAAASQVTLSGKVTYDFVPHNSAGTALDYSNITAKAGRGLVVEILDVNGAVLATSVTDNEGNYSVAIERDKQVKVRVKAQLLKTQSPGWSFKVTDNTQNNSPYAMDGSLVAATDATAVRNLHAASGWTGEGYTQPRVAAPFAILDSVLLGIERINAAGNTREFPALELRWSINNKTADGDLALGEIGTSYYAGEQLYILGDANNDTDEYDRSVILHEFGHYVEDKFSRSDSIGGGHNEGDKLDLRVAMSEGFANAFSAMMLDDATYRDTSGDKQADGFVLDISDQNSTVRGWYSESSIGAVFYNFYTSNNGKTAHDFTPVLNVLTSSDYTNNTSMTSIFSFAAVLKSLISEQADNFQTLLTGQSIAGTDAFAAGETNDGGYAGSLPVYKTLTTDNSPTNVCITNSSGTTNKLGVLQLLRLDITTAGTYTITAQESTDSGDSDPDIYFYQKGALIGFGEDTLVGMQTFPKAMAVGTYIVEVTDNRVINPQNNNAISACFNVSVQLN